MYYEIHGSGEPLILLHGGAGATEMFGQLIPPLAETRQVIAADLQAQAGAEGGRARDGVGEHPLRSGCTVLVLVLQRRAGEVPVGHRAG